jgi:hypothetical protein
MPDLPAPQLPPDDAERALVSCVLDAAELGIIIRALLARAGELHGAGDRTGAGRPAAAKAKQLEARAAALRVGVAVAQPLVGAGAPAVNLSDRLVVRRASADAGTVVLYARDLELTVRVVARRGQPLRIEPPVGTVIYAALRQAIEAELTRKWPDTPIALPLARE